VASRETVPWKRRSEIACIDEAGRPIFRDLLFRRRQCVFIAFDLLFLNGEDLRTRPLIERKAALKKLLRRKRSRILTSITSSVMAGYCSSRSFEWTSRGSSAKNETHRTK
jgi:hypothetical protein